MDVPTGTILARPRAHKLNIRCLVHAGSIERPIERSIECSIERSSFCSSSPARPSRAAPAACTARRRKRPARSESPFFSRLGERRRAGSNRDGQQWKGLEWDASLGTLQIDPQVPRHFAVGPCSYGSYSYGLVRVSWDRH